MTPEPTVKRNVIILLLLAPPALASLGGCSKLSIDIDVVDDMRSIIYQLEPTGQLTVKEASGRIDGQSPQQMYQTQLDPAAMARLRKIVRDSGFLFESPPLKASLSGVFVVMEIHLGMWENKIQIRGTKVPSVGSIVDEINTHLPAQHEIPYNRASKQEEDYEKYLR